MRTRDCMSDMVYVCVCCCCFIILIKRLKSLQLSVILPYFAMFLIFHSYVLEYITCSLDLLLRRLDEYM